VHIISIVSGKGGVGKTTTSIGVALALIAQDKKVAILDLDLENPSLGTTCSLSRADLKFSGNYIIPPEWNGIKIMSLSLLPLSNFSDTPTMINEERKHQIIMEMFRGVNWEDTEILIVDMCPGSGEEVRGLLQIDPAGMIVITTPQSISEAAVRRVILMAYEYSIPIIGIVENNLNRSTGEAGQRLAKAYDLPLLAQLKWSRNIVERMEANEALDPGPFKPIADKIVQEIENASLQVRAAGILRDGSGSSEQETASGADVPGHTGDVPADIASEGVKA